MKVKMEGFQHVVLLCCVLVSLTSSSDQGPAPIFQIEPDFVFTRGKLHYKRLTIDQGASSLYVGSMNYVHRLWLYNVNDTNNRAFFAERQLSPHPGPQRECSYQHIDKDYQCQNHIRVLEKLPGSLIYVCGTNAYKPTVVKLDAVTLEIKETGISGAAICPVDPDDNGTAVWVESGNPDNIPSIYAAAVTSRAQTDRIIYRPALQDTSGAVKHRFMRTMHTDPKWLNEPDFVASFDVGDQYVYFFFREPAIEYTNCGKTVYSRVARVCKNDRGGEHLLVNTWATYLKARLNCSVSGEFPFYFDHIQSVTKTEIQGVTYFYATFTTSQNGFYGSAVCLYSLRDINRVFDQGRFKGQKSPNSGWYPVHPQHVPSPRPGQCVSNTHDIEDGALHFIKSHLLMDEPVPSFKWTTSVAHELQSGDPLLYKRDVLFNFLAVDQVNTAGQASVLVFVGTKNGELLKVVHKVSMSPDLKTARLLAIHRLPHSEPIRALQILPNEFLYVAQASSVSQVSVYQCAQYKLCTPCTSDPYCSWNVERKSCSRAQDAHQYNPTRWILTSRSEECPKAAQQHSRLTYPGDSLHLPCHKPSGQQSAWLFNNSPLELNTGRHLLTIDSGLVFVNISKYDAGIYACVAQLQTLVSYNITVDDVHCQRPETVQEYQKAYKDWCREFQAYKDIMLQWRKWYEDNSHCGNGPIGRVASDSSATSSAQLGEGNDLTSDFKMKR